MTLSEHLLDLLRAWWKAARPQGWLFPGQNPVNLLTTRQLNRACHAAAEAAGSDKRVSLHTLRHSFATHLLEQKVDIRVIQVLPGHQKLDTTALYSQVATRTIRAVKSPLEQLAQRPSNMTVKPPRVARRGWHARLWRSRTSSVPTGPPGGKPRRAV